MCVCFKLPTPILSSRLPTARWNCPMSPAWSHIEVSINGGTQDGLFHFMEKPTKMDDLGARGTPILGNPPHDFRGGPLEDLFTCRTFDPAQVTDFASAALRIGVILLGAEWFINLCNGDCAGNVGKRNCRCFRAICTRIIGDLRKTFLKYPKIGVPPVIIHFSGIFHEMNHPATGNPDWWKRPSLAGSTFIFCLAFKVKSPFVPADSEWLPVGMEKDCWKPATLPMPTWGVVPPVNHIDDLNMSEQ